MAGKWFLDSWESSSPCLRPRLNLLANDSLKNRCTFSGGLVFLAFQETKKIRNAIAAAMMRPTSAAKMSQYTSQIMSTAPLSTIPETLIMVIVIMNIVKQSDNIKTIFCVQ